MKKILTALIAAAILLTVIFTTSGCSLEGLHLGQASIVTTSTTFKPAPEESSSASSESASSEESSEESSEGESSSSEASSEASSENSSEGSSDESSEESSEPEPPKPTFEGGSVDVNVVTASITIDNDNVVRSLKLDKYELSVEVDENGYLIGEISTEGVKSAKELAYDYGMKASSKLSLEWFEQVENFEKWAVGKTVNELLNMQTVYIDETRPCVPSEPDLNVSVSISVGDFLKVIRLAAIDAGWDPSSNVISESSEEEEVTYSSFFESSSDSGTREDEQSSSADAAETAPEAESSKPAESSAEAGS